MFKYINALVDKKSQFSDIVILKTIILHMLKFINRLF